MYFLPLLHPLYIYIYILQLAFFTTLCCTMMWFQLIYPFTNYKLQELYRWSLWMDKWFHCTLYWACEYLSMLGSSYAVPFCRVQYISRIVQAAIALFFFVFFYSTAADFINIFQGNFNGIGAMLWLPQCQWINPVEYWSIYHISNW